MALIGVNSSVGCPWPNFYFVAALNLEDRGSLGLLIGTIAATGGIVPVYLSFAEEIRKSVAHRRFLDGRSADDVFRSPKAVRNLISLSSLLVSGSGQRTTDFRPRVQASIIG